ncbi:hypothetical protein OED01_09130 [Microbacterium sp. M28]|uniref:hypothetical protein n=1 Tax=Microbacterium sp. M28 TaxID=2962064 RepID=UPI0021F4D0BD|nr:hypothetical protein [Microbacterium sp. M28]UYO95775.1 hypothetical protein OED01_09130 [Microbacterium sp. M28]
MVRIIVLIVWLLLSAWLLVWVGEGLFGVDQSASILPFAAAADGLAAPIMIGVAWGLILTFGGFMGAATGRAKPRGETAIGVGRIVETSRTGLTVNDVPQYDLYLRVAPVGGGEFISRLRTLVPHSDAAAMQPGAPLPVRYSATDHDAVELADITDPKVREAMLDWRIARGLIDPHQVRARRHGVQSPASVLSIRPTGTRRDGQSELAVRLLITPEGRPSWETDTTVFVYPEALSRVQVGSPVWAHYMREDPHTVALTIEEDLGR